MSAEQVFPPIDAIGVARVVFEAGLPPNEWPYPGPHCIASNECATCPRWRCPGCSLLRPWCMGCDGDCPELCNDCWDARSRP